MIKKLLIIVVILLLTGCSGDTFIPDAKTDIKFRVITIDECEYVVGTYHNYMDYAGYGYLAHKGNCKYCALRLTKQLKSNK